MKLKILKSSPYDGRNVYRDSSTNYPMKEEPYTDEVHSRFNEIVSLLEKNLKYIESIGMGEETVRDYRKVLIFLKSRTTDDIVHIFERQSSKKKPPKEAERQITDEELSAMTIEQIKSELSSSKLPRPLLERLASVRFGVTKGALATLRSQDALKDKLLTLLSHEGTHASISRAALGQSDVDHNK